MDWGSRKQRWSIAAVTALAIAADACGIYRSVAAADAAPQVAYTLLNGTPANTAALTGRVALVTFWATSCAVCLQEMPAIVATHRRFQARGFETLAVAMGYDAPAHVVRYSEAHQLPFQVAIDHDGSLARGFGEVSATPTSVLINRRGEIVERYIGRPDFVAVDALIERLLAEH